MPRVSVIVAAFNAEETLPAALASVQAQTLDDWEVVVCDDCSTDDTAAIAEGFADRTRVVRTPRNLGPAAARNLAIEASSGPLIAILDADDHWSPEYLASQVSLLDRSNAGGDVGIVACDARFVDETGEVLGTYREQFSFPEQLTLGRLLAGNQIFISVLVPRLVLDQAGGFATETFASEDWDLWIRIVELGYRVVRNPEVLVTYRKSRGQLSADRGRMARNMLIVYRRALERGRLDWRERWVARRGIRTERLVSDLAEYRAQRAQGRRFLTGKTLRLAASAAVVAAQSPRRWPAAVRRLARS
jgi:glycosyltransferase involved in cell wall biosynthesis